MRKAVQPGKKNPTKLVKPGKHRVTQWEYQRLWCYLKDMEVELEPLGRQGWEVVGMFLFDGVQVLLKRRVSR